MSQPVIRQAAEPDIQSISLLQQHWFEEGSTYGFVPESQQQVAAALDPYLLVAELDGQVVGFLSGSVHRSEGMAVIPEGESYLEINNLYVSQGYRRRGVGSSLITRILARAREQGVAYAALYSATKDIHAVLRFYERQKFQSWYVQMFRKL